MADDIRIARWDLHATAGTTVSRPFTITEAINTLSVYTGGTVTDVDDLTGATAFAATVDGGGLSGTIEVDVPTGSSVPLRLVIDGAVVAAGRLTPSTTGTATRDGVISIQVAESSTLSLDLPSIISGGGGGVGVTDGDKGNITVTNNGTTWTIDNSVVTPAMLTFDPATQNELDAEATIRAAADGALSSALTTESGLRAAADTALDGRLDTIEADYTTSSELSSAVTAAVNGVLDGAPGALDTLNELAAAINDDASFAATVTSALAGKQPLDADLTAIAGAGNGTVLAATTASFTTADETKLDGIESGATADQSAAELLTAIKTVDGTGSGLDADTVDGVEASALLTTAAAPELIRDTMGTALVAGTNVTITPNDGADTITIAASASSGGQETVIHGATAGTARPTTSGAVLWIGSVEPTNATNDDLWFDTDATGVGGSISPTVPLNKTFTKKGLPGLAADYSAAVTLTQGYLYFYPFVVTEDLTVTAISAYSNTANTGASFLAAIYSCTSFVSGSTMTRVADTSVTLDVTTSGLKTGTLSPAVALSSGLYAMGVVVTGANAAMWGFAPEMGGSAFYGYDISGGSGTGDNRMGVVSAVGQTSMPASQAIASLGVAVTLAVPSITVA